MYVKEVARKVAEWLTRYFAVLSSNLHIYAIYASTNNLWVYLVELCRLTAGWIMASITGARAAFAMIRVSCVLQNTK